MPCCSIWEVFDEKNLLIKEYNHWKLLVRKPHIKLGSCVAITKQHHERFSNLSAEEMQEFNAVVKDIERALHASFSYDKINYLMLMMKDKHTHFHILPRYQEPRTFASVEWNDDFFPDPLVQQREPVPQDILEQVRDELRKKVKKF